MDLEAGSGNYNFAQLVLNWSFFDRGAGYNIAAVTRQIEATRQRLEQTEQEIRQRVVTAETDMQRSRALAEAALAEGVIREADLPKLRAFRANPKDEGWRGR